MTAPQPCDAVTNTRVFLCSQRLKLLWLPWGLCSVPLARRDARYLVALARHGGVFPRQQELPDCARLGPDQSWLLHHWSHAARFSLPVLVLSYPWLDRGHPDPTGSLLQAIAPVLTAMLDGCGPVLTIGVMIDYCSLPQHPRCDADDGLFERGLLDMHRWYAHPFTHVLLVTTPIPKGAFSNRRDYLQRGWCLFELLTSQLVKNGGLLWDFSRYKEATDYDGCCAQMRAGRKPPLDPNGAEAQMRAGLAAGSLSFSYASDSQVVIDMYRRGFIAAFDGYRALRNLSPEEDTSIYFAGLGWTDRDAERLAASLAFVSDTCEMATGEVEIHVQQNCFTSVGVHAVAASINADLLHRVAELTTKIAAKRAEYAAAMTAGDNDTNVRRLLVQLSELEDAWAASRAGDALRNGTMNGKLRTFGLFLQDAPADTKLDFHGGAGTSASAPVSAADRSRKAREQQREEARMRREARADVRATATPPG